MKKLIVEIEEEVIDKIKNGELPISVFNACVYAVENGKPLQTEYEEIKAELKELDVEPDGIHFWRANRHETINVVLHTIDNHISELKGENK